MTFRQKSGDVAQGSEVISMAKQDTQFTLSPNPWVRALMPIVLVSVTLTVQDLFRSEIGDRAFLLLYPAIFFGCLFGSRASTLIASAIAALGAWYFFLEPHDSFKIPTQIDLFGLTVFFSAGILASVVSHRISLFRKQQVQRLQLLAKSQESEAKYKALFDNLAEEIFFWQPVLSPQKALLAWQLADANPPALKSNDLQLKNILGKTADEILGPGSTNRLQPLLQKVLDEKQSLKVEDFDLENGRHYQLTIFQMGEWFATSRSDITEIVRARRDLETAALDLDRAVQERTRELKESQSFLDSVVENIPNMVFVKDAVHLRFVRFNKAGEDLIGLKREELLGKNDFDFFPEHEAQHFVSKDREVLRGRSILDIPEETINTKNQGVRILHTRKIPIFGQNNRPEYLLGISEDITDRKKAEMERLQLIQTQLEKEAAFNMSRRLEFLAEASSKLNSSLELECILKTLTQLTVPKIADWCSVQLRQPHGKLKQLAAFHCDPDKVKWVWELHEKYPLSEDCPNGPPQVLKTGKSELISEIAPDRIQKSAENQEHLRIIENLGLYSYICAPIRVRRNIIGTLSLATTESSKRRLSESDLNLAEELCARAGVAVDNALLFREAQNLNRVKDEFLATLSHELRTPINVIQGHADILLNDLGQMSEADLRTSLSTIQRNTRLQTQIISDLLDVSSIITGKMSFTPASVSPAEVTLAVVDAIRPTSHSKNIKVVCDLARAPARIMADPTRLQQILWNLVNNSVKFTPPGGKVEVIVEAQDSTCIIHVRDTGIGIEREFLPYVFDRFRQADSSMSRRFGGLGLGLSIVKSLAEIHGGHVEAESLGPQRGSVFTVYLPIQETSLDQTRLAASTQPAKDSEGLLTLKNRKVLLVEDSLDNRTLVRMYLKKTGATVFEAESPRQAREIIKTHKPDLIISDIGMPDENGLEFIRRLRNEEGLFVPAIALTAYVRQDEIAQALAAGFQAHIAKPVSRKSLISCISDVMGLSATVMNGRWDSCREVWAHPPMTEVGPLRGGLSR